MKKDNPLTRNNTWLCANCATLGVGYWRRFMACNRHLIESKCGQKFSVERSNWSTYTKYNQIYEHVYNEMAESGFTRKLDVPVLMNEKVEVVENK